MAPATAGASSVSASGGTIAYAAANGETNRVTVAPWGMTVKIGDSGTAADGTPVKLTAGPGCSQLSFSEAACWGFRLTADTGDGDDSYDGPLVVLASSVAGGTGNDHVTTGLGADTLDGGSGTDQLSGGAGDDSFDARDGVTDALS
jgi:hypothetical protein